VIPPQFTAPNAKTAFKDAFEMVGGVPRLAHWADGNYGRFLALFSKTLPLTVEGNPDRPLQFDVPWLTPQRFSRLHENEGGAQVIDFVERSKERHEGKETSEATVETSAAGGVGEPASGDGAGGGETPPQGDGA
jgi:hypothetical protein